ATPLDLHTSPTRRSSDLQTRSALFMPGSATPAATSAGAPPTTEAGTPTSNTAGTESAQSLFETLGARSPLFVAGLVFLLGIGLRSEEHTSELQSRENIVC